MVGAEYVSCILSGVFSVVRFFEKRFAMVEVIEAFTNFFAYAKDPFAFLESKASQSDFTRFQWGPYPIVLISAPDLIHEVLIEKSACFSKDLSLRRNRLVFGAGLLTSEQDVWKRQRKMISPAFNHLAMSHYESAMISQILQKVSLWQPDGIIDIHEEMTDLTLRIVLKTIINTKTDRVKLLSVLFAQIQTLISRRINSIVITPDWIPLPENIQLKNVVDEVDKIIYSLIDERRKSSQSHSDLLGALMEAKDDDTGRKLNDQELRDQLVTLVLAGHETTAIALTWLFWLLDKNPGIDQQLSRAVAAANDTAPTVESLQQINLLSHVILEGMRLYPPVWSLGREVISPCTVGGNTLKVGTSVMIAQWIVHRQSKYFSEPLKFNPLRWEGDFQRRLPKFAYFPFGGGPRICIGNGFAISEIALTLALVLKRFKLQLVQGQNVQPTPGITLRPSEKVVMKLVERN